MVIYPTFDDPIVYLIKDALWIPNMFRHYQISQISTKLEGFFFGFRRWKSPFFANPGCKTLNCTMPDWLLFWWEALPNPFGKNLFFLVIFVRMVHGFVVLNGNFFECFACHFEICSVMLFYDVHFKSLIEAKNFPSHLKFFKLFFVFGTCV